MFSYELICELKNAKGLTKDSEVLAVLPKCTKSIVSEVKSGKRHLTEEQALFIASECNLNTEWVLVQLAEETAKSEEAKSAWHNLAKKLNKSVLAAILAVTVVFGGLESNGNNKAVFA
ncbi:Phage related protein [Rheinheimera pacifica]|uniref:Phage related protein n=1 Tax=Rheinheimera pacifica TaxID=173990 RepID=A0A1H6MFK7_9GAMM|nr:DUF3693 domain-containing protein [Rheinheimera pacifica]SEH96431.1 Phage related protein [Rheinheimera pacifica]